MRAFFLSVAIILATAATAFAAQPIAGVWKTIDDETNEPKSLIRIYEYNGQYFGRVIKLFKNPDAHAKDIKGDPLILGLDVIWNMREDGDKFTGGKILDPKKGRIYTCEIWKNDDASLNVRGKIGPFGRNQKWLQAEAPADSKKLIPAIPEPE